MANQDFNPLVATASSNNGQPRTVIHNGVAYLAAQVNTSSQLLSLEGLVKNIDAEVARQLLFGGMGLKTQVKQTPGGRIFEGLTPDKYVIAVPGKEVGHDDRITSLQRCIAAAALWCIRTAETNGVKTGKLKVGNIVIVNSLAMGHGLTDACTAMYYCYNAGLEFMCENYIGITIALLAWRTIHRERLYRKIQTEKGDDFMRCGNRIHEIAVKAQCTIDGYIKKYRDWEPFADILARMEPDTSGSRRAKAIETQNAVVGTVCTYIVDKRDEIVTDPSAKWTIPDKLEMK